MKRAILLETVGKGSVSMGHVTLAMVVFVLGIMAGLLFGYSGAVVGGVIGILLAGYIFNEGERRGN